MSDDQYVGDERPFNASLLSIRKHPCITDDQSRFGVKYVNLGLLLLPLVCLLKPSYIVDYVKIRSAYSRLYWEIIAGSAHL
jgi:hypothetical protein